MVWDYQDCYDCGSCVLEKLGFVVLLCQRLGLGFGMELSGVPPLSGGSLSYV